MKFRTLIAALAAMLSLTGAAAEKGKAPAPAGNRVLIAFYSYSDNTRAAAKQIQEKIGGELYDIKPEKPYPTQYKACVVQAQKEIRDGFTPKLTGTVDLAKYDIIFLGSPNWWGTLAPPVRAFIKTHDLSGKIIIPFFTHGGGGMQNCEADMKKYCEAAKAAKILPAATYSGALTHSPLPELVKWASASLDAARKK
ncbi:MAG: flavodoxin [Lentisphaeria bacterium]|nr:flavodoxin [Lentisphaeria bacterium]